jgi:chromosome partitioning protein
MAMSIKEFSAWLGELIAPFDPLLKIISYIVGPAFAIVAFWLNRKHREELTKQATQLGQAREAAEAKQREVDEAQRELAARGAQITKLRHDLESITEGAQELWKLRPPRAFPEYMEWMQPGAGARLITFGNLKGGVGKTTLAANFAAYLSHKRHKPVLLVDLDYQGSLSNMLMLAIEREEVESRVDWLFDEVADLATLDRAAIHLVPKLCQAWLVPANYTFAQLENRLLLHWMLQRDGAVDVRYRLAHALLRPEVRRKYAAIIFDMPPRMTLGALNALVASHTFVVPTVLDKLSAEAVGQFLTNMRAIRADLKLNIELAGIAGVMTRAINLAPTEVEALERAREGGQKWKEDTDYVFKSTLPRRVDIANAAGGDIAYFGNDTNGPLSDLFDPLFEEICAAVWKGDGP